MELYCIFLQSAWFISHHFGKLLYVNFCARDCTVSGFPEKLHLQEQGSKRRPHRQARPSVRQGGNYSRVWNNSIIYGTQPVARLVIYYSLFRKFFLLTYWSRNYPFFLSYRFALYNVSILFVVKSNFYPTQRSDLCIATSLFTAQLGRTAPLCHSWNSWLHLRHDVFRETPENMWKLRKTMSPPAVKNNVTPAVKDLG